MTAPKEDMLTALTYDISQYIVEHPNALGLFLTEIGADFDGMSGYYKVYNCPVCDKYACQIRYSGVKGWFPVFWQCFGNPNCAKSAHSSIVGFVRHFFIRKGTLSKEVKLERIARRIEQRLRDCLKYKPAAQSTT